MIVIATAAVAEAWRCTSSDSCRSIRCLEFLQRCAGIDAEFVGERGAQAPAGVEGIRLPAGEVQSSNQLSPQRLSERVRGDKRSEIGDNSRGATTREFGFGACREGYDLLFLEACSESIGESEAVQIIEYLSPPFLESVREVSACLRESAAGRGVESLSLTSMEAVHVALWLGRTQPVAGWGRDDDLAGIELGGLQELAQMGDEDLDVSASIGRRPIIPRRGRDGVRGQRAIPIDQKHGEHGALPGSTEGLGCAIDGHLEGPEDAEFEARARGQV